MANDQAIASFIQNILGNSPKSSLLFGAPAISVRQIHASLDTSSPALSSQDILVAAAQAAEKVFKGSKHAQLKKLMRAGTEEEWIVFRPTLAASAPPNNVAKASSPMVRTEVHNRLPREDKAQRGKRGREDDLSRESNPGIAKEKTITGKLFRPFLSAKTSKNPPSLGPDSYPKNNTELEIVLPPAHRIGSTDFGNTLLPVNAIDNTASDPGPRLTQTGVSNFIKSATFRRPPRRNESTKAARDMSSEYSIQQTATITALSSATDNKTAPHRNPIGQTYIPVDIDKPSISAGQGVADTAPSSLPYLSVPPDISGKLGRQYSLPPNAIPSATSITRDPVNEAGFKSATANWPVQPHRPRPLELDASTPRSTLDIFLSPNSSTPYLSSLSASSLSSATSVATSSLLTPSYFSDPPSPSSPFSPVEPKPWLSVALQDLPFGPDVPAFHVFSWAKNRWRILGAEMVVVLGAVYFIQAIGI